MLLAIDIGNSNVSLGVFQGETLRLRAKISVQARRSADEYAAMLYDLLRLHGVAREGIDGCILSSVVPGVTGLVEAAARTVTGLSPVRVGPGIRTGFRIRIDDPSQLGGDLVADTLAALTEYGAPLVLVDAGTVTSVAAVDADRTYLGGCILPGIRELAGPEEACLGRSSAEAIRRGLLLGNAMMVDGFIDRYTALPGMAGAVCVATGGSCELVTALCRREVVRDPDLTLKGLRYLYESSQPRKPRRPAP